MGKPRYAQRRDGNEGPLVKLAREIGGLWISDPPFDGWLKFRERWHLVEIKLPEREGHADEYTDYQIVLMARGVRPDAIWRTVGDVYKTMGVRVGA